jgi:RNA polymerase sigma factor (sigma-70 family)
MVHGELWTGQRGADGVEATVRAAARGDQPSWAELVDRYAGLVWSIARAHRLGDADAADVSQATWTRLVEHLDRLEDPAAVGGWLATTARRECLRVLRQSSRYDLCEEVPEPAGGADGALDAALLTAERDAVLWRAFAALPARDRALLRLLASDPAPSYEEISAGLGMPIGSIGPTRARALERLRREIHRQGAAAELTLH